MRLEFTNSPKDAYIVEYGIHLTHFTNAWIISGHCSPLNAAEFVGATRVGAQRCASVIDGDQAVGARVERAERFAALGRLTRVGVTQSHLGVRDRNEAVRAADGVAEQFAALGDLARVGVAHRVLGVVDRREAVGAADGVAEQCSIAAAAATTVLVTRCAKRNYRCGWEVSVVKTAWL